MGQREGIGRLDQPLTACVALLGVGFGEGSLVIVRSFLRFGSIRLLRTILKKRRLKAGWRPGKADPTMAPFTTRFED